MGHDLSRTGDVSAQKPGVEIRKIKISNIEDSLFRRQAAFEGHVQRRRFCGRVYVQSVIVFLPLSSNSE